MSASDRPYFLEHIKTTAMTRKDIEEMFEVSRQTASVWVRLPQVVPVEGSYPVQFQHRGEGSNTSPRPQVSESVKRKDYAELPNIPNDVAEDMLNKIYDGASPIPDINDTIRKCDSVSKCATLESILAQAIVLVRQNKKALTD